MRGDKCHLDKCCRQSSRFIIAFFKAARPTCKRKMFKEMHVKVSFGLTCASRTRVSAARQTTIFHHIIKNQNISPFGFTIPHHHGCCANKNKMNSEHQDEGNAMDYHPLQPSEGLFLEEGNHCAGSFSDCCSTPVFPSPASTVWNATAPVAGKTQKGTITMPRLPTGRSKRNDLLPRKQIKSVVQRSDKKDSAASRQIQELHGRRQFWPVARAA